MKQLDELNIELSEVLSILIKTPAEELQSDDLVSNLLSLVGERQVLVSLLLSDDKMDDADYLQHQLDLTKTFTIQSNVIMADRQALLHVSSKNKRQINVYETIDSNR
ncbi:flagella biosynthesis chaperone for FliD, FliT [Shewanella morhuae]|uniref:flagella biosynthesis chaperone for FliD, FliT n=1 Tax=Shewanella TaxID=22 RepID=UPI0009547CCC|nr:flagella biosynthesis chaperone for FliD, FliT [Shewanella morhuae]SIQ49868.1 hypothetical protein SAMN05421840_101419 [Shewanella morhuae]